jgi:hypothetical protein
VSHDVNAQASARLKEDMKEHRSSRGGGLSLFGGGCEGEPRGGTQRELAAKRRVQASKLAARLDATARGGRPAPRLEEMAAKVRASRLRALQRRLV